MTAQTNELAREQHHMLLDRFVQDLQRRGYDKIHTCYHNNTGRCLIAMQPPCNGRDHAAIIPDIYAEKGSHRFIFEIEMAETIQRQETLEQLGMLTQCAKKNDVYFYLVVPEEIQAEAKAIMERLPERDQHKTFVMPL